MKTKIITGLVLAGIVTTGAISYANSTTPKSTLQNVKQRFEQRFSGSGSEFHMKGNRHEERKGERGGEGCGMIPGIGGVGLDPLTEAEKTSLNSMTEEQKQAFFETKQAEMEAKMEARETVIDKLLAGETLTDADKVLVEEIKVQRAAAKAKQAEMKAKQAEMKATMDAIRLILEKKKTGTTLTTDEQAKLDAFKAINKDIREKRQDGNKGMRKGGLRE